MYYLFLFLGLYPPFSSPLMSRGKPFETHPSLFGGLPPGPAPAVGGHLNPLFSSHLQAAASVPGLHNPYFGLPNPFLPGVTGAGATMSGGQKSPILSRTNGGKQYEMSST